MGKTTGRIQWIVVVLLWVYIIYRAFAVTITEDEAYSYFLLKTNYWRALPGTANTHWLNTLVMRLFMWLPGADRPYKLRMLSVGSWWVFAYSAIKLSRLFRDKWVGIAFFAFAVLNPFLVLYFSQARGYAAGCAFALLSCWQAARVLEKGDLRPGVWLAVVLPASVAVLANFSFFYFFIGVTLVYMAHLLFSGNGGYLRERSAWKWGLVTAGTFLFAAGCLLFIKFHSRDLEFVEYPDLVRSSFGSLVRKSLFYDVSPAPALLLGTMSFIGLLIFSLLAFYLYFRSRQLTPAIFPMLVFVVILLLDLGFHVLFHTSFLYGRTALVIYVTVLPGVFGMIDNGVMVLRRGGVVLRGVMGLMIVLLCFNFYKRFNPCYFYEWPVQADTEKCLDFLVRSNAKKVGLGFWHRDVFILYYSRAYPEKYGFVCDLVTEKEIRDGTAVARFDHLLLTIDPDGLDPEGIKAYDPGRWKMELYYPGTGAMVLERRGERTGGLALRRDGRGDYEK